MTQVKKANYVQVASWHYMGGETISGNGGSQLANVPYDATIIQIAAETHPVYYALNAPFATASAPGYVPDGGLRVEGPLGNLNTLAVHQAAGGFAHISYYREG